MGTGVDSLRRPYHTLMDTPENADIDVLLSADTERRQLLAWVGRVNAPLRAQYTLRAARFERLLKTGVSLCILLGSKGAAGSRGGLWIVGRWAEDPEAVHPERAQRGIFEAAPGLMASADPGDADELLRMTGMASPSRREAAFERVGGKTAVWVLNTAEAAKDAASASPQLLNFILTDSRVQLWPRETDSQGALALIIAGGLDWLLDTIEAEHPALLPESLAVSSMRDELEAEKFSQALRMITRESEALIAYWLNEFKRSGGFGINRRAEAEKMREAMIRSAQAAADEASRYYPLYGRAKALADARKQAKEHRLLQAEKRLVASWDNLVQVARAMSRAARAQQPLPLPPRQRRTQDPDRGTAAPPQPR